MNSEKISFLIEILKYANDHDGDYRNMALNQLMIELGISVAERKRR